MGQRLLHAAVGDRHLGQFEPHRQRRDSQSPRRSGVAGIGEGPFQCHVDLIRAAAKGGHPDFGRMRPPLVVDGPKRPQQIRRVTTGHHGQSPAFRQPIRGIDAGGFKQTKFRRHRVDDFDQQRLADQIGDAVDDSASPMSSTATARAASSENGPAKIATRHSNARPASLSS